MNNNPFDFDKGQYIGQTRLHVSIGKTQADDNDFYKSLKNLYAVEYINQKEIKRVKLCFMTLHNVKQLMKKKNTVDDHNKFLNENCECSIETYYYDLENIKYKGGISFSKVSSIAK